MDKPNISSQYEVNNIIWLEKYRPKSLKDYLDYQKFENIIQEYINPIKKNNITYKPFLILYGDPGVGKTSLAHCVYNDYMYDKIECNASETRTKKMLSALINTGESSVIYGDDGNLKKPGLIMDEIDGISTGESNGIKTLLDFTLLSKFKKGDNNFKEYSYSSIVKKGLFQYKVRYPVICTTNSIKEKKIKPILDLGILIKVYHPSQNSLLQLGKKINKAECLGISNTNLIRIVNVCKPEYRCLIIFLHEIYLFIQTLNDNITAKYKKIYINNHIDTKIGRFELNNQLSSYVNLPIHLIVSNLITHYPLHLKQTYDLINSGLNLKVNSDLSEINNRKTKILKYKHYYQNELESLIQVDNNLINYNILENSPIIIQDICNYKLINIKKSKLTDLQKRSKILFIVKDVFNILQINNEIMKLNNNWREYIEINKEWDIQDYCNSLLMYLLSIINQFNFDFGKIDKGCSILHTRYHTKYNSMKQFLGLINNQIMFHYTDINSDNKVDILGDCRGDNKDDCRGDNKDDGRGDNKDDCRGDSRGDCRGDNNKIIYQGATNKLSQRKYFNIKHHMITSNINYLYMYYQIDNNVAKYEKGFNVGISKIEKIIKEII